MTKKLIQFVLCVIFLFPLCGMGATRYFPLRYEIMGIPDAKADKNAMTVLQNLRSGLTFPFTQHEIQKFYEKAPAAIQKALLPYGYFRSDVQGTLTKTDRFWVTSFHVTPGPELPITSLQIDIQGAGSNDPAFLTWKKNVPLQIGKPLKTETYENVKATLSNLAIQRGYFDAKLIKSQIQINLAHYHAHVIIIVDTGKRYRIGETTFSQSPFHEKFLRRFIKYEQGQYYNAEKLEKTQDGLVASNYFSQVTVKPVIKEAVNDAVPIQIELIPRKAKAYTFGAGYGTDTGVRGTIGVTLRNIGHNGHRFHVLLRGSQYDSSLTAKYLIPGFDPARDLFTIGAGIGNIQQSTGNAHNAKFGLTYTLSRGHWKHSLTLAYLTERYNLSNLPNTSTTLVYPTLDSQYLRMDRKTNPNNGIRFDTQFTGASAQVLSQTDFFQATTQLATLYTISATHTRLLFHTNLGHTNIPNLNELPLSLQLFAGGAKNMRGYGYNSIGPGRNMVVASTELQQRIFGSWYLAGFIDAGVVGNQNLFQHINVGTGPGIAWITTIGTIELTAAEAFTQSNKPWTLQFTMGTFL